MPRTHAHRLSSFICVFHHHSLISKIVYIFLIQDARQTPMPALSPDMPSQTGRYIKHTMSTNTFWLCQSPLRTCGSKIIASKLDCYKLLERLCLHIIIQSRAMDKLVVRLTTSGRLDLDEDGARQLGEHCRYRHTRMMHVARFSISCRQQSTSSTSLHLRRHKNSSSHIPN